MPQIINGGGGTYEPPLQRGLNSERLTRQIGPSAGLSPGGVWCTGQFKGSENWGREDQRFRRLFNKIHVQAHLCLFFHTV